MSLNCMAVAPKQLLHTAVLEFPSCQTAVIVLADLCHSTVTDWPCHGAACSLSWWCCQGNPCGCLCEVNMHWSPVWTQSYLKYNST